MSSEHPNALLSAERAGYLERCLRLWGAWERGYQGGPQPVRVAIWAQSAGASARADATATEVLSKSDKWVAQNVSKAIEALPRRDWQMALELTYVWNGAGPAVWRSNRLDRDELAQLVEGAKEALVPILRRRHLPL
jgi:hypothetical protein